MHQQHHQYASDSTSYEMSAVDSSALEANFVFRRGPVRWLMLSGLFLIAVIAVGTAAMVGTFRERALDNSRRELENTVLLLTRHFDQQLAEAEVVQKDIMVYLQESGVTSPEEYRRKMAGEETHKLLKSKISAMSYVGALSLVDSDGKLISTSRSWPTPDVSLSNRLYFKALKSDPNLTAVLSEPLVSRVTGAWTITLSRRLNGPNGDFLGVVSRGIEPAHFEDFFTSLALGENATISMFHSDGTLLARFPRGPQKIGSNLKDTPLFQTALSTTDHGSLSLLDDNGKEQLASIRTLTRFPLAIAVTTSVSAALTDWREQTRYLIFAAILSAAVVSAFLLLIIRQLSLHHRSSERKLTLQKQRLDTAINNMTPGLLLFDASERIVVVNDRFIDMYGLSSSIAKPGCNFRDLIRHQKEAGALESDFDDYCAMIRMRKAHQHIMIVETNTGRIVEITTTPLPDGGWVSTHEDVTQRRRSQDRIAHLAHYDALTNLPNRVMLGELLEQEIQKMQNGDRFAVIYIDIDEFKTINDSLGHPVGDELLKLVADRLQGCLVEGDFVARLGGDEFAIVQTAIKDPGDTIDLVTRVHDAIRAPCKCLGHEVATDASIGVALAPDHGVTMEELLKNADLAMYDAKREGRRTYRFFELAMELRVKKRRQLEIDMRQILADGQFSEGGLEVYYQPLVNLKDGTISGCEALLRWKHPVHGMISPAEFIPVAEETGQISELGAWVLKEACNEAASWPSHIKIAVNISPVQFRTQTLALNIVSVLAESGLSARRLELEITEAVLIRDDDAALAILHQLRDVGVRIALDDFGTGYSSLSYLQRFPFDKIKIDRCFVTDICAPHGSSSIVQAVVNIAVARNMTTTAEGVETAQQRDLLRTLGCTEMQGYLFSPAKPSREIAQMLGKSSFRAKAEQIA